MKSAFEVKKYSPVRGMYPLNNPPGLDVENMYVSCLKRTETSF